MQQSCTRLNSVFIIPTIIKFINQYITDGRTSTFSYHGYVKKINLENIVITRHSQIGTGVFIAITIMEHKDIYKADVPLSPTHEETSHTFGWNYDLTKVNIPTLIIAGTKGDFETKWAYKEKKWSICVMRYLPLKS